MIQVAELGGGDEHRSVRIRDARARSAGADNADWPPGRRSSAGGADRRPSGTVSLERRGDVAVLLLNRPPVNAYDYGFLREIGAAIDDVRADDSATELVINSAIPAWFSAGADLLAFATASPRVRTMTCLLAQEVFLKLERSPFPVTAEIHGNCLGGGLELALACHERVAFDGDYSIGLPEILVGLLPGSGGTQRLPRLIGLPKALDLVVSGRRFNPAQALQMGIIDRLLPVEKGPGDGRAPSNV